MFIQEILVAECVEARLKINNYSKVAIYLKLYQLMLTNSSDIID